MKKMKAAPFCNGAAQTVKITDTEQSFQSNPATSAADLVFLKRKRRKNNTDSQDCARKTLRFSAIRSSSFCNENRRFSLQVSKSLF